MTAKNVICAERLYLTKDRKKVVLEGDERAATLYATPGDTIPGSAVEAFGLEDGKLAGKARTASVKRGGRDGAKEKAPAGDKEKSSGGNKGKKDTPPTPPQLTDITGIGPATAKALAAGGIETVEQLAAIDPAAAPTIDDLPAGFAWVDVVAGAKAVPPAAPAPAHAQG